MISALYGPEQQVMVDLVKVILVKMVKFSYKMEHVAHVKTTLDLNQMEKHV